MTHTPGPLHLNGNIAWSDSAKERGGVYECRLLCGTYVPADQNTINSRLLAAAYNSYDKHFGPLAVEAAESDLLGEALEVLTRVLSNYDQDVDSCAPITRGTSRVMQDARALLAKSKGVGK